MSLFSKGKTYNFSTHAPSRLGQEHKSMILTSDMTFVDAILLFPNIPETFKIVYPNLPAGIVDDYRLPTYLIFQDTNGTRVCMADIWIVASSVEVVERQQQIYTVSDPNLSSADIPNIMRLFSQFGYNNVTVAVKTLSAPSV